MKEMKIIAEPGKLDMFITREFDAPRELVFRAFVEPELLVQWLGPEDLEMRIDYFDGKSGGAYRYVSMDANGNEYGFHGAFHEITAPIRAIQTFEFEGLPQRGHVSLDCADFEELPNNRTRLVIQSVFRSVEDRDGKIAAGMERGMKDGYRRLDEMLEKGF